MVFKVSNYCIEVKKKFKNTIIYVNNQEHATISRSTLENKNEYIVYLNIPDEISSYSLLFKTGLWAEKVSLLRDGVEIQHQFMI